jgi:predicted amidohydrolase
MRLALMQAQSAVLDVASNLEVIDRSAAEASAAGAELLLTPELFPVGYAPRRLRKELAPETLPEIHASLEGLARAHGIALLYSLPEVVDGEWRITATLVDASGTRCAHYAKVHLFGTEEQEVFSPGSAPPVVADFGGLRLGIAICYDIEFHETARAAALQGAQALLVPTAMSTGYEKVQRRLIPTRALESQLYVAYANHCGNEDGLELAGLSVIADPFGDVIGQAGAGEELLFADLDPSVAESARGDVPYLDDRRPELYREWNL